MSVELCCIELLNTHNYTPPSLSHTHTDTQLHTSLSHTHTHHLKVAVRDSLLISIRLHSHQSFLIVGVVSSVVIVTGTIVCPVATHKERRWRLPSAQTPIHHKVCNNALSMV